MKKNLIIFFLVLALVFLLAERTLTIFVMPPGLLNEGVTLVIPTNNNLKFIESADSICARQPGGVNPVCRTVATAAVPTGDPYLRLPYMDFLYMISTGFKRYE